MKLKKQIGAILLLLVSVFSNASAASLGMIGVEDMPDSLKDLR